MKIRGLRECKDCGREWSYYETGSVTCPACGSIRSVGVDERTRHTDTPVALNLSPHRDAFEEQPTREFVDGLKSTLRTYRRRRGFIAGGDLRELDDTYLAASELLQAADVYGRLTAPDDDERRYLIQLLRGADQGDRPAAGDVPTTMQEARGLAYGQAVREYRREAGRWLEDSPDRAATRTLGTLDERAKRVEALQGDVPPAEAERLVTATREIARYLTTGDETALATARDRLEQR
jgi:hypothetical protein